MRFENVELAGKKVHFKPFFCLLLFGYLLKYLYVCWQANVTCPEPVEGNRQQAQVFAENRTNRASRPSFRISRYTNPSML